MLARWRVRAKRRAGIDHVAGLAVKLEHLARIRRWHFDHGLRGLHRNQRCIEFDRVARVDEPFHDRCVGQAFAQVGKW